MIALVLAVPCLLPGEGQPGNLFSFRLAAAGDLDGDGTSDVLVSDPVDADRSVCAGRVWAVSGKSLSVIHTWKGEARECLGSTLASAGDIDGDGVPDAFLGTGNGRPKERGFWRLVSGRSGEELYRIEGVGHDGRGMTGPAFAGVGDVDGDSRPDFVIGEALGMRDEPFGKTTLRTPWGGRVSLRSGRSGVEIWRIDEPAEDLAFGFDVLAVGDVDRDGTIDVGALNNPRCWNESVRILSGKDGRTIRTLPWGQDPGRGQCAAASGFDLDGDSTLDVVVVTGNHPRRSVAYSGRTGAVLRQWDHQYPTVPHLVPDVDADGIADLVLTSPATYSGCSSFAVFSGGRSEPPLLHIGFEPWMSTNFACSVISVPDRDGDRVADLLVGEASQRHHGWLGEARFYSTRTGRLLGSITRASLEARPK